MKMTDQLQAGFELDELIAEEVMGWICDERGAWVVPTEIDGCGHMPNSGYCIDGWECDRFSPSEEIHHAWEIVEKMLSKGYDFELYGYASTKLYDCHFSGIGLVSAETMPLAICNAAIQAVRDNPL